MNPWPNFLNRRSRVEPIHLTVETSLKFEADIREHKTRAAAVAYAVKLLVDEGWSQALARETVEAGKPALLADDGNDWTIEVRTSAGT